MTQNKIKILWILNGCGLVSNTITGGPLRFFEVSKRWQARVDIDQSLLTTSGGETMLSSMGMTIPTVKIRCSIFGKKEYYRFLKLWSYVISTLTSVSKLKKTKSLADTDVVITASDYFCDIIPAVFLKKRKKETKWIACIYHKETHPRERPGNLISNYITWWIQEQSFRKIAKQADLAWLLDTAAGDDVEKILQQLGMDRTKITKIFVGIDLKQIKNAESTDKKVDAIMIGIRPNKGLYDIIPVWEEVQKLRPGTSLHLMGGMSGHEPVFKEIRNKKLDSCIKLPDENGSFINPDEFYKIIKRGKVFFAPSHEEGWGIALCEAMSCGLPVIAYDLPVYDRIYGGAFSPVKCFDTKAMAQSIVKTLNDADEFQRLQKAGFLCSEQYDWDKIADDDLSDIINLVSTD
jgi:glycosyltransferase involved in cell wall biosynthesis